MNRPTTIFNLILSAVLLLLTSCAGGSTANLSGEVESLQYAGLLTLTKCDGYTVAEIRNPWGQDSTSILHRYILVPRDETVKGLPTGDVIKVPIKKAVVYTSVHASLLNEIGGFNAICGVCDEKFMYLDKIHQGIKTGNIADCGESGTPNIEKIMDISPDAVLLSPFENSSTYGKLGNIGIPLIECADYMENSPLGRAEWVRFYGMLFGCETKADSLFASVEKNYNELKGKIFDSDSLTPHPSSLTPRVVTEKKTGNTWYVAGADSYAGRMLADAGANYVFKDLKTAGSQPYDPEVVFDKSQDADFWLLKYSQASPITLSQLAKEWGAYTDMKAFKTGNVWGCNLSTSLFYEETPFHPDLLLKDYVKIFHPEILKDYHTRYYFKILN